jgi:hypothetical protein
LIGASLDEPRDVDHFERPMENVEPGVVRKSCR